MSRERRTPVSRERRTSVSRDIRTSARGKGENGGGGGWTVRESDGGIEGKKKKWKKKN
jgi:hypothetical protein